MPIFPSEIRFKRGLAALAEGNPAGAVEFFRQAITIERQHSVSRPRMRYVSYYGLSLVLANGPTPEAVRTCERAARLDSYDPELHLNLGKVCLLAGRTTRALAAFERGLKLAPDNYALQAALAEVDRRGRPVLPFLDRSHPMNRWLGKIRHEVPGLGSLRAASRRSATPS
jgi:tetratricopeptide (TPR) repeat protein